MLNREERLVEALVSRSRRAADGSVADVGWMIADQRPLLWLLLPTHQNVA